MRTIRCNGCDQPVTIPGNFGVGLDAPNRDHLLIGTICQACADRVSALLVAAIPRIFRTRDRAAS